MVGFSPCSRPDSSIGAALRKNPPPQCSRVQSISKNALLGRRDVLIETEEIVRIVLLLETREFRVIHAIRSFDRRRSLLSEIVHIGIGSAKTLEQRRQP